MAGYKHLEIVQDFDKYVKDKKSSARAYYRYLLTRLLRMFQYKNLPDTIPHEILDRYLFENGIACITKVDGKLYVFYGNLGGPQDVYYRPTEFIISNPHIKTETGELFTANVPVFPCDTDSASSVGQPTKVEGVLIRNDSDWLGLHPLISRYAYLMAENTLTLRTADVMLRVIALITAKTDKEQASALEYLKSIEKGELGLIGESAFHEGIELQSPPSNNGSYLTQFIEYQQYLKGSFYNEVGLSSNYNMKREAIGKGESTLDEDALLPLCDNMLVTRREDLAKVNEMFGTSIEVEFSSSWLENRIEALASLSSIVNPVPAAPFSVGQPTDGEVDAKENEVDTDMKEVDADMNEVEPEQKEVEPEEKEVETEQNEVETEQNEVDENGDSKINDLSVDEELEELLEVAKDVKDEPNVTPLVDQGGEENEDSSESSDDKADPTDN